MTSQSKSKAQRRAESQRRAAEKRAAELRKKRIRIGLRVGGVVVALALVIVLITTLTGSGGNGSVPPQLKNPHVRARAHPRLHVATLGPAPGRHPRARDGPGALPAPNWPR